METGHRAARAIAVLAAAGVVLGGAGMALGASDLTAQELRLSALQAWPDHELLGSPLGVGIAIGFSPLSRIGIRLGYETYGDEIDGFGSTCAGLLPPSIDCAPEPRSDDAHMHAFSLAVPVTVVAGEVVRVHVVPGARTGEVDSDQEGLRTGRTRSADKSVYGLEIGGELEWTPVDAWPLHVSLGGYGGVLRGWEEELIADGYAPFEQDIGYGRLQLGVTLRR